MENSSFKNLNDLEGMEDFIFFQQSPADSIEELSSVSMAFGEPVLDFKRAPDWCGVEEKRPLKQLKTTSSCKPEKIITHSTATTFHFVNNTTTSTAPSPPIVSQLSFGHENDDHVVIKKSSSSYDHGSTTRHPSFAQERMLAERRRREHLTQRFIALSALLPGLKKMDKASVLGDAIKYMKQLQQKVELLEEQASKVNQASVLVRKHEPPRARNENPSSSDEESNYSIGSMISSDDYSSVPAVPEIEARMCNNDVLIKIQCEKKKGLLEKTVGEIEKLNLSVVNSSVMSFGDSSLSISLVAQKDEGFSSDMKQLVNNLRAAISKYSSAK